MSVPHHQVSDFSQDDATRRSDILQQRAARLAARLPQENTARGEDVLIFEIQGELAGLRAADCREVVKVERLAPVPDAMEGLLGLLNVQNELVCLVDVRPLVWPAMDVATGDFSSAIVLRHPSLRIAIACDSVQNVQEIRADDMVDPGSFRVGSRFASMLTLATLLAPFETADTANPR